MGKELTLFGNSFEIPDSRIRYNKYRDEFNKEAIEASRAFEVYYTEHIEELDQIVSLAENYGKALIHNALLNTIRRLISKGIYETDTFAFVEGAVERPEYFQKAVNFIKERIASVEETLRKAEAARQAKIDSASSSWSGGGYGIEGALKGAAEAAILNAASGALTSALTSGEAKKQLSEHDRRINNILSNNITVKQLSEGVYKDIFCLLKTYVDILQKTGTEDVVNITDEEMRRSASIYQNLKDNLYDNPKLRADMWVRMLQYYPYDVKYFTLLLNESESELPNILDAAQWYNISMNEAASALLEERYNFDALTELSDVENQKNTLLADMQKYMINETPLLALADNRMAQIRLERRTYKGVTYDNEESKGAAENLDNRLTEMVKNVNHNSIGDVFALYMDILGQSDYKGIRTANANILSVELAEMIQKSDFVTREQLESYQNALSAGTDSENELHKPVLKAINAKIKKMNFNDKKEQMTTNISNGISNISNGIGGLFRKRKNENEYVPENEILKLEEKN